MGTEIWGKGILMYKWVKKYRIEEDIFEEERDNILMAIEMIKDEADTQFAKMTASDYKVARKEHRVPYHKNLMRMIEPCIKDYMEEWHCEVYDMQNVWFAEYRDGADFDYHSHEGCNMSGVVQLVLDHKENATYLMNHGDLALEEGDCCIFPAMLPHKSPYVFDGHKIVIGFNFNISGSKAHSDGLRD